MTERLLLIPPDQVRGVWPKVRAPIVALQEACDEAWLPEDVFNELIAGTAFIWALADLSAFLVIQLPEGPEGRDLHAWICYNSSGEPPIAYWDQLLWIARQCDCKRITFENDRSGFQRHIPGLRVRYLYSAQVPGGDDGRQEPKADE